MASTLLTVLSDGVRRSYVCREGRGARSRPSGSSSRFSPLRVAHPMLDVRLFAEPRFTAGTGAITVASLALAGLTFALTQYLQTVRGYTPLEAGVRVLPLALGFMVGAPGSSRLVAKVGRQRYGPAGGRGAGCRGHWLGAQLQLLDERAAVIGRAEFSGCGLRRSP